MTPTKEERNAAQSEAALAWSRRVRRVGGFIQAAFAAFWLVRGGFAIGDGVGGGLAAAFAVVVFVVVVYAIRFTAGVAPRPTGREAGRIERSVTVATIVQLVASFAVPALVIATDHSDWALPSIAMTIGPLLLWLNHRVHIPRYRPVGWTLIVGPVLLVAIMSDIALSATTGIAAGTILVVVAVAGFHDLAPARRPRHGAPGIIAAGSAP